MTKIHDSSEPSAKTYILSYGEYMYEEKPYMVEFTGTWRELLLHVCGADGTDDAELQKLSDAELLELFSNANGDGQAYLMVWSVDDARQVLGE